MEWRAALPAKVVDTASRGTDKHPNREEQWGVRRPEFLSVTASGRRPHAHCARSRIKPSAVFQREKHQPAGPAKRHADHWSRPQRDSEDRGVENSVDNHRRKEGVRLIIHPPENNAHERIVDSHVSNDDRRW